MKTASISAGRMHGSRTAEALTASLARAGLRDAGSSPLIVERGWPLGKTPLMLRCHDPEANGKKNHWWSVYFTGSGRPPYACRKALEDRTAVYLEDLAAVVQRFPRDLLLSDIQRLAHKTSALPVVQSVLAETSERRWTSLRARLVNYKPSRRLTLGYRLSDDQGAGRTIFAKLLPQQADRSVLGIQQAMERRIAGADRDHFSLAPVIGHLPDLRTVFWRRAPGRSLFNLLSSPDLAEVAGRIARCLAGLHGSRISWDRVHDQRRELQTVRDWMRAVDVFDAKLARTLESIFERIQDAMATLEVTSRVPSHRDFYDRQILVDDDRFTLLDLEVASLADPELDVANFLAHLELRSLQGRVDQVDSAANSFVAEYRRAGMPLNRSRLHWYMATSLLRLSCVYALRTSSSEIIAGLQRAAIRACECDRYFLRESA